jgi:hypothetical protein
MTKKTGGHRSTPSGTAGHTTTVAARGSRDRLDAVAGAVAHFQRALMMEVDQAAKAMREEEINAEIEDFLEGFNQPTCRGMRISGLRVGYLVIPRWVVRRRPARGRVDPLRGCGEVWGAASEAPDHVNTRRDSDIIKLLSPDKSAAFACAEQGSKNTVTSSYVFNFCKTARDS